MAQKYQMTVKLDFGRYFSKHGKSPKFEAAMLQGVKAFDIYLGKKQKQGTIDVFYSTWNGDAIETWISADKHILDHIAKQMKGKPQPDDSKVDKKFFKDLAYLDRMFKIVKVSQITPLNEAKE